MKVVDTTKNGGHSVGGVVVVFDDCYFMACGFPPISFKHCNREAKVVAHELTRLAKFFVTRLF